MRPFLKWVGGKRQLLPELRRFYPPAFGAYFEPFLGSGAVFFDLWNSGRLAGRHATLIDDNLDLVGAYVALRDDVEAVVEALGQLAAGHGSDPRAHYYRVRDERFNPARARLRAASAAAEAYGPELAAMLIYLNRTGYNGLFRLNARGDFNVPIGRYTNPRICDADNLRRVGAVLGAPSVTLRHGTFETIEALMAPGDLAYFDPPYAPVSRTARFTAYTAAGFSARNQADLQRVVVALARRGCHVLLSNSTAPDVAALYDARASREAGLHAHRVPARRAVNSRPSRRGTVEEFVVTNVRGDADAARLSGRA